MLDDSNLDLRYFGQNSCFDRNYAPTPRRAIPTTMEPGLVLLALLVWQACVQQHAVASRYAPDVLGWWYLPFEHAVMKRGGVRNYCIAMPTVLSNLHFRLFKMIGLWPCVAYYHTCTRYLYCIMYQVPVVYDTERLCVCIPVRYLCMHNAEIWQ